MKKVLSALLTVIMVAGLMVGCAGKETESAAETETTTSTETASESKTEAETTEEEEAEEWSEEEWLPLSDGETLTIMIGQSSKVADYDNNNLTKWIEETTGVNVEFHYLTGTTAEKQQQVSLMVAGGETLPDIIWGQFGFDIDFVNELGRDGYVLDLSQYMYSDLMPYFNRAIAAVSERNQERFFNFITDSESGEIYNFPHYQDIMAGDSAQSLCWINTKWLEAVGLDMPASIDELHEVLIAFRDKDPNGNGKKDEIPMLGPIKTGGADILPFIINAYVYYDADFHFNATDGQLWTPFTSDEYREALKTINVWFEEGLIAQQCFTGIEAADMKPIVCPEDNLATVGIWCGHPSVYGTQENATFFEYDYLPALTQSETDKGGWFVYRPGALLPSTMITADCENVELAVKFCDFFFSDKASASMRHGIYGKNWEWKDDAQTDRNVKNIAIIDDGQAFFAGVDTWCANTHAIMTAYNYQNGAAPATEWLQHMQNGWNKIFEDVALANYPDEVVTDISYTADERSIINSHKQIISDYIREGTAKFGTGAWDIENDADWNTYLNELKAIGLDEYLATAQTAYTRMKSR